MTNTDDPKRAYIEGFRDGWTEAMKYKQGAWSVVPTDAYDGCRVCGRSGIDNYVCYLHNCPSKITSGAGAIGASYNVGVGGIGTTVPAANGPTGDWK